MKCKQPYRLLLRLLTLVSLCCLLLTSCGADMGDTVFSYQEETISSSEVTYWIATMKTRYLVSQSAIGNDTEIFWNSLRSDGVTHAEHFKGLVKQQLSELLICKHLFDAWDLDYPNGGKSQAKADIANKKSYYEGEMQEWEELLSDLGVTETQLVNIYLTNQMQTAVKNRILSEFTVAQNEYADALQTYFLANYRCVKIVAIYQNYDPNNPSKVFTPTEIQEKNQLADTVLEKGQSGTDAKSLIAQYSENKGELPENGIFLTEADASAYDEALYQAIMTMQIGEWKRVDTQSNGISCAYLIYREQIGDYNLMSSAEKSTFASRVQSHHYQTAIANWMSQVACDQAIWDTFSVIAIPASKNTNI